MGGCGGGGFLFPYLLDEYVLFGPDIEVLWCLAVETWISGSCYRQNISVFIGKELNMKRGDEFSDPWKAVIR